MSNYSNANSCDLLSCCLFSVYCSICSLAAVIAVKSPIRHPSSCENPLVVWYKLIIDIYNKLSKKYSLAYYGFTEISKTTHKSTTISFHFWAFLFFICLTGFNATASSFLLICKALLGAVSNKI